MALPFRKSSPKVQRLPASVHARRLETSPLYIRREREAAERKTAARIAAAWYLDPKFTPRWS